MESARGASTLSNLAVQLASNLTRLDWTVATVESATGGLISEAITRIPGSSVYFAGSLTAYRNDIKIDLLGILTVTGACAGPVGIPKKFSV